MTSPLPDVDVDIQDGGLGQIDTNAGRAVAKVGVCPAGVPGTLYSFSEAKLAQSTLGKGRLAQSVATQLAFASPVYVMPVAPTTFGTVTNGAHTGTGTGTITPTVAPPDVIIGKITTGGALGVGAVAWSVGGGAYGTPQVLAASMLVPGTLTTVTVPAGTYVLNDLYTSGTGSAMARTGTGPNAVTQSSSPLDVYTGLTAIVQAGGLGVGTFKYSTDGGANYSGEIAIPSGGIYQIPSTGIVLTFAGTFVAGDTYAYSTTASAPSTSDITTALDNLANQPQSWGLVHIDASPTSVATCLSLAAAVDSKMYSLRTSRYRFARAIVECPQGEGDATIAAAAASFASTEGRTSIGCGDYDSVSPLDGKVTRRNVAWLAAGRFGATRPGLDCAAKNLGPLPTVKAIYRNEEATPALDAARFVTLRTFIGEAGYYLTNFRTMAVAGSDFTFMVHCRTMDVACQVGRSHLLNAVNDDVRVDVKTGFIDERDAQAIEAAGNAKLKAALVDTDDVTQVRLKLSRTQNIISTNTEPATISIIPKAYTRKLSLAIGFRNPALSAAA